MKRRGCLAAALWLCVAVGEMAASPEPLVFTVNAKKWSRVLDDRFISVTVNPTDLLQGKAFGLGMNSTVAILQGLSPAYIRIGSGDTGKYTFKRSRYPSNVARTEDEFIVTESHWTALNEVARSAGLDVIVCLNAAQRTGSGRKWDTRNSLELISFSDSQGYNLTFQLGYEVQRSLGISGRQYGKDLKRLRTILNAFPRYQNSKLIGPDIRVLQKKEDVEFVNEALSEAGPTLDAITWHPRWPQPSKMKVSDVSELGYEFPSDYIEWDRSQLSRVLQRSTLKNPLWIGEPKTESTGTFAEGLLWARRLVYAARLGIQVVMKQPSLMDISHPKPEYWIAFLHKRLLGRSVLETRPGNNQTDVAVVAHCTNPLFWAEKPNKPVDGAVTVYAVNMGGKEKRMHVKGTWSGKSPVVLQYLLTSGTDPDSVFSQMTYLNGEPLMMTDDGNLPDVIPRIRRMERGVFLKLPPYSAGFWVVPEARVKICQTQPTPTTAADSENVPTAVIPRSRDRNLSNVRNLNQLIVDKLKNPESEESFDDADDDDDEDGVLTRDSEERDGTLESVERPRTSRRVRQITAEDIGSELKEKIREIREMLQGEPLPASKALRSAEEKVAALTAQFGSATRLADQREELARFLHRAGLNQDFGALMAGARERSAALRRSLPGKAAWPPVHRTGVGFDPLDPKIRRFRRSLSYSEDDYEEESPESYSSEEEDDPEDSVRSDRKTDHRKRFSRLRQDSDEGSHHSGYPGPSALNGLGEKYRNLFSYRNEMKRGKKQNEARDQVQDSKKPNALGNDLQEEILMKEVEVLQKTEEAMANLIKNHKKRQETIEEIILHEISDIKEDRLTALEDVRAAKGAVNVDSEETQRIMKKKGAGLHEAVQTRPKVKRSVGEAESTVNDIPNEQKKPKMVKRSADSYERAIAGRKSRRGSRADGDASGEKRGRRPPKSRSERLERMKNFIQSRERIRDRNIFRRKSNRNNRRHRLDGSEEESNEVMGTYGTDFLDRSEDMVIKEIQKEILKKPERKVPQEGNKANQEGSSQKTDTGKMVRKEEKIGGGGIGGRSEDDNGSDGRIEKRNGSRRAGGSDGSAERDNSTLKTMQGEVGEISSVPPTFAKKASPEGEGEHVPLKMDKNRGLSVLKRISNLVESISTREKSHDRKPTTDVDDLSDEFYGDAISKLTKRRHRRSHHREGEEEERAEIEVESGESANGESTAKNRFASRKEAKLRRIYERRGRKTMAEEATEGSRKTPRSRARLRAKLTKRPSATEASASVESVTTEAGKAEAVAEGVTSAVKEEKETRNEAKTEISDSDAADQTNEAAVKAEGAAVAEAEVVQSEAGAEQKEETTAVAEAEVVQSETGAEQKEETTAVAEAEVVQSETGAEQKEETSAAETERFGKGGSSVDSASDAADTVLVIPATGGFQANPAMEVYPENMDLSRVVEEVEGASDSGSVSDAEEPIVLVAPYATEVGPRDERAGTTDLIAELLEGEVEEAGRGGSEEGVPGERSGPEAGEWATEEESYVAEATSTGPDEGKPSGEAAVPEEERLRRRRRSLVERRTPTPEERIRQFKRLVHRRHSPFGFRNEVPVARDGDTFWKMAGSTVKAVFNDVIPEAYGKTKDKIENLGIAEYFKEFGKIVEQMKNLDRLFANIGQAAVRNYIKGSEDEKGDYIQVIGKKRRSRRDVEETAAGTEPAAAAANAATAEEVAEGTTEGAAGAGGEEGRRSREEGGRGRGRQQGKERPNDLIRDIFLTDSNPGIVEVTRSPGTTESPRTIPLRPFEPRYPKTPRGSLPQGEPPTRGGPQKAVRDGHRFLADRTISNASEMHRKFSPWMKTTKDFISQALTTLQRQRELSEMIARESVNDLVKREIERKVIGKREAPEDAKTPPAHRGPANEQLETRGPAEEGARYLRHLQPGVYIVPTAEMENLRSEQITKEAPATRPGMPNVVTLNIYYDKKTSGREWDAASGRPHSGSEDYPRAEYLPGGYRDAAGLVSWSPVPVADFGASSLQEAALDDGYLQETGYWDSHASPLDRPPESYRDGIPSSYAAPRSQGYYYPAERSFAPAKSDWSEFGSHPAAAAEGNPYGQATDSGWAVRFRPAKAKKALRREPVARPPHRPFPDKKRSVGVGRPNSEFPGLALPFWKFFVPKSRKAEQRAETSAKRDSDESDSLEELFAENRKRARLNAAAKKEREAEKATAEESEAASEGSERRLSGRQEETRLPSESRAGRSRRNADGPAAASIPGSKRLGADDASLEVPGDGGADARNRTEADDREAVVAEDVPLSHFFRYAYDSLVQMMKGMTNLI